MTPIAYLQDAAQRLIRLHKKGADKALVDSAVAILEDALEQSRRGAGRPETINKDEIRRLRKEGKTAAEISALTGASTATIYRAR